MSNPQSSRTRWRIALAVVAVFAAVAWLVAFPVYKRHRAIQEIVRVGGRVYKEPWGFGFDRVIKVSFGGTEFVGTEITDDGLKHLSSLTILQVLDLYDTDISDEGMKHLSGLTNLQELWLDDTEISDEGLKHLRGLTNLEVLSLRDTHVSDDGVEMLQESLPSCRILR